MKQIHMREREVVGNEAGDPVLWARIGKTLDSKALGCHAKESELGNHSQLLGKVVTRSALFSKNVTLRELWEWLPEER